MHKRKQLTLFMGLLFLTGLLSAQVKCNYHGLKDTLSKTMLSNLDINNYTGVEIHNAFDAQVHTAGGQLVYRYYVPKMINAPWNGKWSLVPGESRMGRPAHVFMDGKLVVDELDLPAYTGDLRMSLTLRHPLDTQSIVCRTVMTLPVAEGIIDFDRMTDKKTRKSTGYFDNLKVELPEVGKRFTPADLAAVKLVNKSGHIICDDLEIHLSQQGRGRKVYGMKLTNLCIPPGEHTLSPEQIATAIIEDRFAGRDTLRPLQMQYQLKGTGRSQSKEIPTKLHGALTLPKKTYYNPALNLSVDFVTPLEGNVPFYTPDKVTVVEDTTGQVLEIVWPRSPGRLDLKPASPFGASFMNRSFGGVVTYRTLRSEDLNSVQLPAFLAKMMNGISVDFKSVQRGAFEVLLPAAGSPVGAQRRRAQPSTLLFAVRYRGLIYIFAVAPMGMGGEENTFDRQEIAEGIELDGHRFQFSFPEDGGLFPEDVSIVPGTNTVATTEEAYAKRLNTFLFYAKKAKGKGSYQTSLEPGKDQGRLDELLTFPYTNQQLDSVAFPAMKREVLGAERFSFKQHSEDGFEAKWGVPEQVLKPGFSLLSQSATGAEWTTTFGIDKDGNLTKWASPGVSSYGSMHQGGEIRGFSFSVAEFPRGDVPKEFYRAITLQNNSIEHSIRKTMLHDNEQYDVYRSPFTTGFLLTSGIRGCRFSLQAERSCTSLPWSG